jgi:hypothetical protein
MIWEMASVAPSPLKHGQLFSNKFDGLYLDHGHVLSTLVPQKG